MTRNDAGAMPPELERAQRFAWALEGIFDADLVSVVLYGSAARGEYRPGVSDLNVLVVLREMSPAALRAAGDLAREWVAEGNAVPLFLSADELRRSADVWAIEMTDIRDAHLVLLGADPFEGVTVDPADLRLQCERELKGKHIQLRERYLLFAGQPEELGELLVRSFSTFLVLFRTVLRLTGTDGVRDAETVVHRVAQVVGFSPEPMLQIHRARAAGEKLRPAASSPLVVGYLDAVSRVVDHVDRLVRGG
ncbi:nucleotidyltransferase domain-containing protein [Longimicrobium sp.]|uniref:nucleotidyltransferase domain-containing protein n=1 Tax=Longimicrobium sp. TaxID=2029185 RepID=UPI002E34FFB5|nr:nucleotidyltransferase domain-containing protein [Longimicrobium sp.]HEX6038656.1 nucleotidyltransferase domain-containing protein [Longimicrobium sp.]